MRTIIYTFIAGSGESCGSGLSRLIYTSILAFPPGVQKFCVARFSTLPFPGAAVPAASWDPVAVVAAYRTD